MAALVVLGGYVVFGVTGFGSPITIPVLAHLLPLHLVLAVAAVLDLASGLALGLHTRRPADRRDLLALVPFTLIGVAPGVTLLVNLPRRATLLALGVFVCAYALYAILRPTASRRLSRGWTAPSGIAGGVLGALFGVGGLPYVVYITGRVPDPAAQRATISQMLVLSVGLRVVAFALAGLFFSRDVWLTVGLLLPAAWAGLWLGKHLHVRIPPATLVRVIGAVLLVTGASLIVRTLS